MFFKEPSIAWRTFFQNKDSFVKQKGSSDVKGSFFMEPFRQKGSSMASWMVFYLTNHTVLYLIMQYTQLDLLLPVPAVIFKSGFFQWFEEGNSDVESDHVARGQLWPLDVRGHDPTEGLE